MGVRQGYKLTEYSVVEVQVTDPETMRTITEIVSTDTIKELNEKLQKAYNKCLVEVLDKNNKL